MINYKSIAYISSSIPVPVEMIFEGQDPYTVEFAFHVGCGEVTRWNFAKELLDELEDNFFSGEGDVHFELDENEHKLYMSLSSPEGFVILEFDPCSVESFLDEINFSPEFEMAGVNITDEEIYGWLGDEAA
jgi:hypothetical protein